MTAGFELLVSADLLVSDVLGTSRRVVDVLGLPEPKPHWLHDFPEEKHQVNWLRIQHDRGAAPTAIEVIGPHPQTGWAEPLQAAMSSQGDRPMKTHNTVVGVSDTDAAIERLERAGVPHVVDRGQEPRPFTRIWVGTSDATSHADYDPRYDAGLMVELLPTAILGIPEPRAADVPRGSGVRLVSRSFIVGDIDAAVAALDSSLGWQPSGPVATSDREGARAATFDGTVPNGASLELLAPTGAPGPAGEYLRSHGAGAYRIVVGVNGLEEAASRLADRGVAHQVVEQDDVQARRVRVDPAALDGLVFDLVDITD